MNQQLNQAGLASENARQYAEAIIQAWNNEEKHVPIYPAFILAREYLLEANQQERGSDE